jgi:hypothetical protein
MTATSILTASTISNIILSLFYKLFDISCLVIDELNLIPELLLNVKDAITGSKPKSLLVIINKSNYGFFEFQNTFSKIELHFK